jgi:hypothetical protein
MPASNRSDPGADGAMLRSPSTLEHNRPAFRRLALRLCILLDAAPRRNRRGRLGRETGATW